MTCLLEIKMQKLALKILLSLNAKVRLKEPKELHWLY